MSDHEGQFATKVGAVYRTVVLASYHEEKVAALEAELATVKKVAYGNIELLEENQNLQAELAQLRAGQEPVAAQVRFRRPEKGLADWSVWQQTTIKPNMPAWSIDSVGYEVEYRLLYTTPQPSAVPDIAGWLWHWLMDYCKKNCQPPATRNDLFAVVSDLRKMLAAAPSAPATVVSKK